MEGFSFVRRVILTRGEEQKPKQMTVRSIFTTKPLNGTIMVSKVELVIFRSPQHAVSAVLRPELPLATLRSSPSKKERHANARIPPKSLIIINIAPANARNDHDYAISVDRVPSMVSGLPLYEVPFAHEEASKLGSLGAKYIGYPAAYP